MVSVRIELSCDENDLANAVLYMVVVTVFGCKSFDSMTSDIATMTVANQDDILFLLDRFFDDFADGINIMYHRCIVCHGNTSGTGEIGNSRMVLCLFQF